MRNPFFLVSQGLFDKSACFLFLKLKSCLKSVCNLAYLVYKTRIYNSFILIVCYESCVIVTVSWLSLS